MHLFLMWLVCLIDCELGISILSCATLLFEGTWREKSEHFAVYGLVQKHRNFIEGPMAYIWSGGVGSKRNSVGDGIESGVSMHSGYEIQNEAASRERNERRFIVHMEQVIRSYWHVEPSDESVIELASVRCLRYVSKRT